MTIVATGDLVRLRGQVVMADGGFDPIHAGHVEYLREAANLALPVLCNISPDRYVERKHPVLLPQAERGAIIDALSYVEYTHLSQQETAEILLALRPRYYVKGADWRGRLPDEELRVCAEVGIETVFLDTVTGSSRAILDRYTARLESWRT